MSAMDWNEAFELAKLRIEEDGVSWATAYAEFRSLVGGVSARDSMHVGRTLQAVAAARDAKSESRK